MNTDVNTSTAQSKFVDTLNGVRLRTVTWGTRETHQQKPIVLVHGLASNAMLWEGAALALCALGHLVTDRKSVV